MVFAARVFVPSLGGDTLKREHAKEIQVDINCLAPVRLPQPRMAGDLVSGLGEDPHTRLVLRTNDLEEIREKFSDRIRGSDFIESN